jgi:hypothetical protein
VKSKATHIFVDDLSFAVVGTLATREGEPAKAEDGTSRQEMDDEGDVEREITVAACRLELLCWLLYKNASQLHDDYSSFINAESQQNPENRTWRGDSS